MIFKSLIALAAFGLQYLLMHSHKAGQLHWAWVAGTSIVLYVWGMYLSSESRKFLNDRFGFWLWVCAGACVLLPPAVYIAREWIVVPRNVSNALVQGGVLDVSIVIIASGGWLFAIALLCFYLRSKPSQVGRVN
jgi:hypothetical protein